MTRHRLMIGDAIEQLRTLSDQSVHCCVTSPPYFGLRDYGMAGQLGLEQTPNEYVSKLVAVFREVRRVLRDDGTLWLNVGDSYASGGRAFGGKCVAPGGKASGWHGAPPGLKAKDLIGVPWRLALALQSDGWYLRSDIIWDKPNAMPESVRDRPNRSHEYVFLLSRSRTYYYDNEAVKEPIADSSKARIGQTTFDQQHGGEKDYANGINPNRSARKTLENFRANTTGLRNKRSVWRVATRPYEGAHFAVFPPDLIEPCILAGVPEKVCPVCGAPWVRVIEATGRKNEREAAHVPGNSKTKTDSSGWRPTTRGTDKFRPTCDHDGNNGQDTGVVLDPFGGSGTVAAVAERLGRNSIYIDLNPAYAEIAAARIGNNDGHR